ncbi:MAG: FAD-dependent oxidoreductase [Patescibacteria group bacterium]|jgi:thioredoxin reductase (NADPH)
MKSDLVIIGGGPAALAASIYASRYGIKHKVLAHSYGGEMAKAYLVENYPGFPQIRGYELAQKIQEQAASYKEAELITTKVDEVKKTDDHFIVTTENDQYESNAILLAYGLKRKHLNVDGEKEFAGKGVAYCATCDAPFYKNKTVAVIGGGNSAYTAAIMLAGYATKVFLIMIEKTPIAEKIWIEKLQNHKNVEVLYENSVKKIEGEQTVNNIVLNKKYNDSEDLEVQGIFIEIGYAPDLTFVKMLEIETDPTSRIKVDKLGETNIEGAYAAGNICDRFGTFDQIIAAEASGIAATYGIYLYQQKHNS